MSARLFGAALGLGQRTGSRSGSTPRGGAGSAGAEKADEQPAARMATPRLRIVRPAPPEAAQDPPPRRAGLATRREPHARESRDSPIDRQPEESSSRLRVTRPEAASQEAAETTAVPEEPGRDPYVAAQSGRVARTASREPRADPAPAASQAAARAVRRERPAVESGASAAARAQSVGLFSLAKMRSSSGQRKVRGRGETTTREQRLGDALAEESAPTAPPTRTSPLQVRRVSASDPAEIGPSGPAAVASSRQSVQSGVKRPAADADEPTRTEESPESSSDSPLGRNKHRRTDKATAANNGPAGPSRRICLHMIFNPFLGLRRGVLGHSSCL